MARLGGLALGLAAALCLVAGTAHAQFGQNKVQYTRYKWRSISSDHFDVYFYSGLDSLAMRVIDLAEKTNIVMSRRMGHRLGHKVPIILYGSHNDFAQTNVTPEMIDAGTGGFTEVLRNRVVLPFTGSYEDLRHVVVHELTHAYMFDMLYAGAAAALISRQGFYSVPLWFAEGMAEYFSLGMEPNAEVFLRDGTVEGYLPPLEYSGGYIVYKQGQSAISYLCSRFGEERLRDILRRTQRMRSFERAFQSSLGMSVSTFDEQWRSWLRKKHWPAVASKLPPEEFARRLTDHRKDQSNVNLSPTISPQGDRVAFFSDRRQYTDLYLLSALDGKLLRRVISGERNVRFESIPSFRSGMAWSPDGRDLALTAKSGGRDVLYVVDAQDGRVRRRIELPCDALFDPAWCPISDTLVVAGVSEGRSDLWLVDLGTGSTTRLTNDTYDEKQPCWSPDGSTLVFSSDRVAPVVLHPGRHEQGYGSYGLFTMDVTTGEIRPLLNTAGDDRSPAYSPDGRLVAFVSDYSGTPNIYVYDPSDSSVTQLTDVLGGIQSLTWSRQGDRMVFSAYNRGGFDLFAIRQPLGVPGVLARLQQEDPPATRTVSQMQQTPPDTSKLTPTLGALASSLPDTLPQGPTTAGSSTVQGDPAPPEAPRDTLRLDRLDAEDDPQWAHDAPQPFPAIPDTAAPLETHIPLVEAGGPFALPDSLLGQKPVPYRPRLAPDYAGGGVYAANGYGVVGNLQFLFTDFLGDRALYIATDIFSSSLEETNALAIFSYLPRRWDYSVGAFHFNDYYQSPVSSLGESFGAPRLYSERSFGGLVTASYPTDRFRRFDFNLTQMFLERQFYNIDPFGYVVAAEKQYRSVTSPAVSLVGDNTLFGYYGPVNGVRYNLSYSYAPPWISNALSYQTTTLDARRYWDLTTGYTFAGRALGGVSVGRNPQIFRLGGFSTLRGYPDFSLFGSRFAIGTAEFRFPFIRQLGVIGPVPVGALNLRGVGFVDVGAVWNENHGFRIERGPNGSIKLPDPTTGSGAIIDFGTGIRTSFMFLILKLDVAWNTDLSIVGHPLWHFSIGPEF